ncbi:MAG: hypothetical protein MZU97_11845 [Bacillus subtilis]|nr:hypothetical protein [Bacillus subtilis]
MSEFVPARINKTYVAMPGEPDQLRSSRVDLSGPADADTSSASRRTGFIVKYPISERPDARPLRPRREGHQPARRRPRRRGLRRPTRPRTRRSCSPTAARSSASSPATSNPRTVPPKAKCYLKNVKTNPYQFVGVVSENVFHLKERSTFRSSPRRRVLVVPGTDLKPDKFEHGAPYLEKDVVPRRIPLRRSPAATRSTAILAKLARDRVVDRTAVGAEKPTPRRRAPDARRRRRDARTREDPEHARRRSRGRRGRGRSGQGTDRPADAVLTISPNLSPPHASSPCYSYR